MTCKEVHLPRVHHAVKKPKLIMWKDDAEREADKGHSTYHKVVATKKINKKNSYYIHHIQISSIIYQVYIL